MLRTEVVAAHGEVSLEAVDVRDTETGETTRLESGGLFAFIGADAETAWPAPEIALDHRGYVLTGADVRAAGGRELGRDPYLLETSVSGILVLWLGSSPTYWWVRRLGLRVGRVGVRGGRGRRG